MIAIINTLGNQFRGGYKTNCRLPGGSVQFRLVSIVPNNDNRPEPDGTAGQQAVGFRSYPLRNVGSTINKPTFG